VCVCVCVYVYVCVCVYVCVYNCVFYVCMCVSRHYLIRELPYTTYAHLIVREPVGKTLGVAPC